MSRSVDWLSDRLYKTHESREPTLGFIELLHQYITPSSTVLDLGAGAGEIDYKDYKLRGRCQKIIGVDLDPRVETNSLVDEGIIRSEADTFPTFYRMNTRRRLKCLFESEGFEVILLGTVGCRPNYLSISAPLFLVGALYERLIASCRLFSSLRGTIYCVFQKMNEAPSELEA